MLRYLFVVFAGILLLPLLSSAQCLTTLPPNPPFVPPIAYPQGGLGAGMFWYGTDALWTALSFDGKWQGYNGKPYVQKLVFWRLGFDWRKEVEPLLIITGKRLDGDAPSIAVAHANAVFIPSPRSPHEPMPPAMMTGVDIPTAGCSELTAHYSGHTLTFVVSVEP